MACYFLVGRFFFSRARNSCAGFFFPFFFFLFRVTCETYLSEVLCLRSPSFTKKSGHSIRSECELLGTAGRLGLNDNDLLIRPWVIVTSVNASRLIVSTTIWAIWQILVIWVWDKINLHFSYGLRLLILPYLVFLRQTSLILRFGTLIRAKYIHWR